MRDGTCAFFQIQGIFQYFRAFKTEILHIYSLTGQIQYYSKTIIIPLSVGDQR